MTPNFSKYIGIDYSGAGTPRSRLPGLRVFQATNDKGPEQVETSAGDGDSAKVGRWNWTREELAHWLLAELSKDESIIVGIDHCFSFPDSYFRRYGLKDWDEFLEDFQKHWWTEGHLDEIREENPRRGRANEFRLTEKLAKGTQSVFKFVGQGTVGKSSHSGIPWLRFLRRHPDLKNKIHFWPFDGFSVPEGKSVVAETWPTLFRGKYTHGELNEHERDAYCVAKWLQETDRGGLFPKYLSPAPTMAQRDVVSREGWILGIDSSV